MGIGFREEEEVLVEAVDLNLGGVMLKCPDFNTIHKRRVFSEYFWSNLEQLNANCNDEDLHPTHWVHICKRIS